MTAVQETSWSFVTAEIERAARDIDTLLTSGVAAEKPVPGLDWNVGELAGHLVTLPRLYRQMFDDGPRPLPDNVPAMNAQLIADLAPASLAERAAQFGTDMASLLTAYGDGSRPLAHWVRERPALHTGGVLLGELVTHRLDLQRAAGQEQPLPRDVAVACLDGMFPAAADFVDHDAARKATGTFHTRLRGGRDWTQTVDAEGQLDVRRGLHGKPDFTVRAEPATMLFVSQGRIGQIRANLTGGIVAYGRKPWKGLAFANIFREI